MSADGLPRCTWATSDPELTAYHDREWGVPQRDERALFELLTLEGAQAGLAWITILRRRDAYRAAFAGFDPLRVASFTDADRLRLLSDAGIVRNRAKIDAAIGNARAWLRLAEEVGSVSAWLWTAARGPRINRWAEPSDVPASTAESEALSQQLRQRGFRFVGPTIAYAFMQSAGMVNDHLVECFRHAQLARSEASQGG